MSVYPECQAMQRIFALSAMSMLTATASMADPICLQRTNFATPTSRFVLSDTGATVTDSATGLMWHRCLLGQTFDSADTPGALHDDTCSESPAAQHTWSSALLGAVEYNNAQVSAGLPGGWRVPNRKELATIEELKCVFPALNPAVFPSVPVGASFWSSTPLIDAESTSAWVLDAWEGGLDTAVKTTTLYVRLVHDAP